MFLSEVGEGVNNVLYDITETFVTDIKSFFESYVH